MNTRSTKTEKIFKFIAGFVVIAFIAIASFDLGVYYTQNKKILKNNSQKLLKKEAKELAVKKQEKLEDNEKCEDLIYKKCIGSNDDYIMEISDYNERYKQESFWTTYRNEEKGYELKIPKNMVVENTDGITWFRTKIDGSLYDIRKLKINKSSEFGFSFVDEGLPVGYEVVESYDTNMEVGNKTVPIRIIQSLRTIESQARTIYFVYFLSTGEMISPYTNELINFEYIGRFDNINIFKEIMKSFKFIPPKNK